MEPAGNASAVRTSLLSLSLHSSAQSSEQPTAAPASQGDSVSDRYSSGPHAGGPAAGEMRGGLRGRAGRSRQAGGGFCGALALSPDNPTVSRMSPPVAIPARQSSQAQQQHRQQRQHQHQHQGVVDDEPLTATSSWSPGMVISRDTGRGSNAEGNTTSCSPLSGFLSRLAAKAKARHRGGRGRGGGGGGEGREERIGGAGDGGDGRDEWGEGHRVGSEVGGSGGMRASAQESSSMLPQRAPERADSVPSLGISASPHPSNSHSETSPSTEPYRSPHQQGRPGGLERFSPALQTSSDPVSPAVGEPVNVPELLLAAEESPLRTPLAPLAHMSQQGQSTSGGRTKDVNTPGSDGTSTTCVSPVSHTRSADSDVSSLASCLASTIHRLG